MSERIFHKLDWYTVMFGNRSFNDVLQWIGLNPSIYEDEFFTHRSEISQGLENKFVFFYEGISLWVSQADYIIAQANSDTCFSIVYPKVRLDISGTGLDFLRSVGIDPDQKFRDYQNYLQPFNITRADFAFDLVDYKAEFLDELINYCELNVTPNGRICLLHRSSGLALSIRKGREKTVYLGAPKALQLLRVYDKRLQYFDSDLGCYLKENPYDNPESWIRIELQTRRDRAHELLFAQSDSDYWFGLLKYIHDFYAFADVENTTKQNRVSHEFWDKLFEWDKIERIIQNEYSVQFISYSDRVISSIPRDIFKILKQLAVLSKIGGDGSGRAGIQSFISHSLTSLFDYDDPRMCVRRERLLNTLNVLFTEGSIDIADSVNDCEFGFYRDCGILGFKF